MMLDMDLGFGDNGLGLVFSGSAHGPGFFVVMDLD